MQGLGGKSKFQSQFFNFRHDFQKKRFFHVHVFLPDGGDAEAVYQNIEAVGAEPDKIDQKEVMVELIIFQNDRPDSLQCRLHLPGGGPVGHSNSQFDPSFLHAGPVVDDAGGKMGIRHRDQAVGEGTDADGA